MADYQTHLNGGVVFSIAAALVAGSLGLVTAAEMPFVAMVGVWGSLTPDIDSDHSRAARIMRDYATVIVPTVILWRLPILHETLPRAAASWLLSATIVRWPLFSLFKSSTVHRGIFHSIPAAAIFGCIAFLLAGRRSNDVPLQTATAISAAGGYLVHLTLDEVWSVDFEGRRIKKSFGTALSLWSQSRLVTATAYTTLALLGLLTYEGLGGRRPEGIWSENLGDAPFIWMNQTLEGLEAWLTQLF
jgi:membrane-bound metal-dependent hydrolase YbcI (DUF457 family)